MTTASTVVRFYRGAGRDACGRTLDDILGWDDAALEAVHDFVQWLFPLDEPSAFNADAPLVSEADRAAFRQDSRLEANLRRAFERMLAFYGLELDETEAAPAVRRAASWDERSAVWLRRGNHNHLRLTRILKSLMILGQPALAGALYNRLREEANRTPDRISAVTLEYWTDAIRKSCRNRASRC
jgi:hypothetical protein